MRLELIAVAAVCSLALLGCDPNAKATPGDNPATGATGEVRASLEHESCSASRDCGGDLRCFDGVCRAAVASTKGDYFAALGEHLRTVGRADAAVEALRAAEAEYKAESLDPPASLMCSLGRALADKRQDPILAEEAASRLHRCMLGSPVGSASRALALRGLVLLDDVGLDPVHLASAEIVDRYLTKAPRKPPTTKLTLEVTGDGRTRTRSYTKWLEAAGDDAVKDALSPCWETYWKATRKTKLAVKLGFKHSYRLDEYDDFDRTTLVIDELPSGGNAAQTAAAECFKNALAPIADEYSRKSGSEARWSASVAFELDT
jgi:hypothetical protein